VAYWVDDFFISARFVQKSWVSPIGKDSGWGRCRLLPFLATLVTSHPRSPLRGARVIGPASGRSMGKKEPFHHGGILEFRKDLEPGEKSGIIVSLQARKSGDSNDRGSRRALVGEGGSEAEP
jgi:hypothetical protein